MLAASQIKKNLKAFYTYVKIKVVTRERVVSPEDKGGDLCLSSEDVGRQGAKQIFCITFTKEKNMEGQERSVWGILIGQVF